MLILSKARFDSMALTGTWLVSASDVLNFLEDVVIMVLGFAMTPRSSEYLALFILQLSNLTDSFLSSRAAIHFVIVGAMHGGETDPAKLTVRKPCSNSVAGIPHSPVPPGGSSWENILHLMYGNMVLEASSLVHIVHCSCTHKCDKTLLSFCTLLAQLAQESVW